MGNAPLNDAGGPGAPSVDRMFGSHMDRLRLRHLRLLDLVAREGSLSAAADALGISQPGATKMLQEIETAFGFQLIERTAKGGRLTSAGQHTLDRLRIALQSVSTARASLVARQERPLVRLGILPLVGINALGHVVGAMQAEGCLPRIQVRLDTVEGLMLALGEGRVDCAVGALDRNVSAGHLRQFKVIPLWEESLVIAAASDHPLARRRPVALPALLEQDWVLMPSGSSNRRALEDSFLAAGLAPPAASIETESFHIGLSLVAGSRMLTAVPESALRLYQSQVRKVPIARAFGARTLAFVTLADPPMLPAVALLAQWFQRHAQTLPGARTRIGPIAEPGTPA